MYKIIHDKGKCIKCGACVATSKNWEMKDGEVNPIKTQVEELGDNEAAANGCPVSAITIKEEK